MIDREKVIKGLETCKSTDKTCSDCPYNGEVCTTSLCDDVLSLLKEQGNDIHHMSMIIDEHEKELARMEPIEPVDDGHGSLICGNQGYECGCVGRYDITTKVVEKYCNFCPECGRKVKWE